MVFGEMVRRIITCLTFLLLILVYSLPVANGQVQANPRTQYLKQEGFKNYWGRGIPRNLEKAFGFYLEAAMRGDREAQYIVGGMYFRGMGTERNLNKAFQFLHGAAMQGKSTPESQKLLGEFFLTGHTVPQNYENALKWYKMAAENGDRDAQSELGYLYYSGRGVTQDLEQAFTWFEKAAYQGLAVAQYSLGIMWYSGNGVEDADPVTSYAWLSVAASNNHPDATVARNFVKASLTGEELKKAQNMATNLHDITKK